MRFDFRCILIGSKDNYLFVKGRIDTPVLKQNFKEMSRKTVFVIFFNSDVDRRFC